MGTFEENTKNIEADEYGELLEIVLNTREQCEMMDSLIKNQIQVKDALIDKLYKELDQHKEESADRVINQYIKAIIKVRKDMGRLINSEKWNTMSADDMRREYTYIYEDITDLLEQQNVDAYKTEPGTVFNPSLHQAKVEVTEDLSLDKTIKTSLQEGYIKGNKVIIPERVLVYQHKESDKEK